MHDFWGLGLSPHNPCPGAANERFTTQRLSSLLRRLVPTKLRRAVAWSRFPCGSPRIHVLSIFKPENI